MLHNHRVNLSKDTTLSVKDKKRQLFSNESLLKRSLQICARTKIRWDEFDNYESNLVPGANLFLIFNFKVEIPRLILGIQSLMLGISILMLVKWKFNCKIWKTSFIVRYWKINFENFNFNIGKTILNFKMELLRKNHNVALIDMLP